MICIIIYLFTLVYFMGKKYKDVDYNISAHKEREAKLWIYGCQVSNIDVQREKTPTKRWRKSIGQSCFFPGALGRCLEGHSPLPQASRGVLSDEVAERISLQITGTSVDFDLLGDSAMRSTYPMRKTKQCQA